jgi:hypothetical protein
MAVFDATALLLLVAPQAAVPLDSKGKPITYPKERIDGVVKTLAKAKEKIVIPTPALSEALVRAGASAANAYLQTISRSPHFKIAAFDHMGALELALMTATAMKRGKKVSKEVTWAKLKFDRQIVAIAKVNGEGVIYTDDRNLSVVAYDNGLRAISLADLPVPDEAAQIPLDLSAQPAPAALAEARKDDDDHRTEAK